MQRKAEEKERKLKAGNLEPQNVKQETGEILRGSVESPKEIVETLGETYRNIMGNGK